MPKRKELAEREREQILEALALDQASVNTCEEGLEFGSGPQTRGAPKRLLRLRTTRSSDQSKDCYTASAGGGGHALS